MKNETQNLDENEALQQTPVMRCSCGWEGEGTDCKQKRYGEYCRGDNGEYGWEEWDNLACPKCGKEVEEKE